MGAGAGSGVVRGTSLGVFGHPAAGEGEAPRLVQQCLADAQQVTKEVRTHHFLEPREAGSAAFREAEAAAC